MSSARRSSRLSTLRRRSPRANSARRPLWRGHCPPACSRARLLGTDSPDYHYHVWEGEAGTGVKLATIHVPFQAPHCTLNFQTGETLLFAPRPESSYQVMELMHLDKDVIAQSEAKPTEGATSRTFLVSLKAKQVTSRIILLSTCFWATLFYFLPDELEREKAGTAGGCLDPLRAGFACADMTEQTPSAARPFSAFSKSDHDRRARSIVTFPIRGVLYRSVARRETVRPCSAPPALHFAHTHSL